MVSGRRVSSRPEGEQVDKERVEEQRCYVAMLEEFVWLNSTDHCPRAQREIAPLSQVLGHRTVLTHLMNSKAINKITYGFVHIEGRLHKLRPSLG